MRNLEAEDSLKKAFSSYWYLGDVQACRLIFKQLKNLAIRNLRA